MKNHGFIHKKLNHRVIIMVNHHSIINNIHDIYDISGLSGEFRLLFADELIRLAIFFEKSKREQRDYVLVICVYAMFMPSRNH